MNNQTKLTSCAEALHPEYSDEWLRGIAPHNMRSEYVDLNYKANGERQRIADILIRHGAFEESKPTIEQALLAATKLFADKDCKCEVCSPDIAKSNEKNFNDAAQLRAELTEAQLNYATRLENVVKEYGAKLTEAKKDSERLNWVQRNHNFNWKFLNEFSFSVLCKSEQQFNSKPTIRIAIDAAMKGTK